MGKKAKFEWLSKHDEAFKVLREKMSSEPVVRLPDLSRPFIVKTDACDTGMGAILLQEVDGQRHVVEYASKRFNKAQLRYPIIEKEATAIKGKGVGLETPKGYWDVPNDQARGDGQNTIRSTVWPATSARVRCQVGNRSEVREHQRGNLGRSQKAIECSSWPNEERLRQAVQSKVGSSPGWSASILEGASA